MNGVNANQLIQIGNPFVGNLILDAFTTEVGAEAYLRHEGIIAMGSVTGGEIRGTVLNPKQRSASYIGKLGSIATSNRMFASA